MKNNENGRSMIEMLGVLAIIGVLSVGGIAGYSKAMSKYRTNKAIDQATMLITNIRTMFAQQQSYADLNNSRAVNLALVPEEMIVNPGVSMADDEDRRLRNIFSGEVVVRNSPIDALDASADEESDGSTKGQGAFIVTFFGLSRDACIQIATSDWGAGSSSGLVGMHIWDASDKTGAEDSKYDDDKADAMHKNGLGETTNTGKYAIPGDETYKVPFTVVQAQSACACTNKTTCAVTWKYF
ncbi:MAG: hypothetical protein IJ677_05180 [Alphaproteobacteria bacterium]|nr:hypothetical protein [Alphaproteobacteria bacterium]